MIQENRIGTIENEFMKQLTDDSKVYVANKNREFAGIIEEISAEIDTACCEFRCGRRKKPLQRLQTLEHRLNNLKVQVMAGAGEFDDDGQLLPF